MSRELPEWSRDDYLHLAALIEHDNTWHSIKARFGTQGTDAIILEKIRYIVRRDYLPQFDELDGYYYNTRDNKWQPRDYAIVVACIRGHKDAEAIHLQIQGRTLGAVESKVREIEKEITQDGKRASRRTDISRTQLDADRYSVVSTYASEQGFGRPPFSPPPGPGVERRRSNGASSHSSFPSSGGGSGMIQSPNTLMMQMFRSTPISTLQHIKIEPGVSGEHSIGYNGKPGTNVSVQRFPDQRRITKRRDWEEKSAKKKQRRTSLRDLIVAD